MIILLRRSLDELLEQYQHPVTLKTASNPNVVALSLTNTAFLFCLGKKKSGKKKKAGRIYISLLTSLFSLIPDVNFLCFFYDPFILDSTFFCSVSRNFCCYWCQLYLCDVLQLFILFCHFLMLFTDSTFLLSGFSLRSFFITNVSYIYKTRCNFPFSWYLIPFAIL